MTKIRLNESNSKMMNSDVYITKSKAFSLKKGLFKNVKLESNFIHPSLGMMYRYVGEYSRTVKNVK